MTFDSLGLNEALVRAVHDKNYTTPTPIQAQAIPAILEKRDVMAAAQTGTGKTAGFTLPILQLLADRPQPKSNHCQALILTPTRELAAQVHDSVKDYGKHLGLRSTVVFGGVKINPQMMALRKGVNVLVATPGRLMDLHEQNAIRFNDVEMFVLDEADRMLDMGFVRDIKKIISLLPKRRQNLLFSATFSPNIRNLAKTIFKNNPLEIDVAPRNEPIKLVDQKIYPVDKSNKSKLLGHLISENNWHQVLVFCRTKHGSDRLVKQLEFNDVKAIAIHGNKSQSQRTKALADFKAGKAQVLVATDIAARGIDISLLPHVVNFDLPDTAEDYVHRIGRTGRAGMEGEAISLVSFDEYTKLRSIERLIKQEIPRQEVAGFEPSNKVPPSSGAGSVRTSRTFSPRRSSFGGKKSSYRGLGGRR